MNTAAMIPFHVQDPYGDESGWAYAVIMDAPSLAEAVRWFEDKFVRQFGDGGVWGTFTFESGDDPVKIADRKWSVLMPDGERLVADIDEDRAVMVEGPNFDETANRAWHVGQELLDQTRDADVMATYGE